MSKNKIIFWIIISVITIFIAILLIFLRPKVATGNINSFEECAKAGYPVMEIYPPQCKTPDGRIFTQEIKKKNCNNLCGDGICQELVCMAIGCPCAENKESCPQDCNK
mgnify:CR=1 FL=1